MSVLISGLTFSIRSTRFALLFIIPPGMTKTLVPVTETGRQNYYVSSPLKGPGMLNKEDNSRLYHQINNILTHVLRTSVLQLSLFGILLLNETGRHLCSAHSYASFTAFNPAPKRSLTASSPSCRFESRMGSGTVRFISEWISFSSVMFMDGSWKTTLAVFTLFTNYALWRTLRYDTHTFTVRCSGRV